MAEITSVAILGPGAVGGFLAVLLERSGVPVIVVGKPDEAERIARSGITLESNTFGSVRGTPRAVVALEEPVRALLIAVKAPALPAALERVTPGAVQGAVVVPFLNGIEHMDALRVRYGDRVIAASIGRFEAERAEPGHILHRSRGADVTLASQHKGRADDLAALRGMFDTAGILARIVPSEAQALWGKLVRLGPLACATAESGQTVGVLRADSRSRSRMEAAVREACAVAAKEGFVSSATEVMAQIDALDPHQTTSLARDIARGERGELDAIPGAIVRRGARHGIHCPTIERSIKDIESKLK